MDQMNINKPVLQAKDLRKVYKMGEEKVVALNRINMDIYPGEICCIFGTSGSGKSTLLNMMAGLEMPSITIQGNADRSTVSGIEDALAKAVRDLERRIPDIINSYQHRQRRVSLAT